MSKKETSTKDLYEGDAVDIWEDDEMVFLHVLINGVTMCFSKEDWNILKDDLEEFINGKPNHIHAG